MGEWGVVEGESERVDGALRGNDEEFKRILPGKVLWGRAAATRGTTKGRYGHLVRGALSEKHENLQAVAAAIGKALEDKLPTRTRGEDV